LFNYHVHLLQWSMKKKLDYFKGLTIHFLHIFLFWKMVLDFAMKRSFTSQISTLKHIETPKTKYGGTKGDVIKICFNVH
jgi:hypothetical protein